MSRVRTLRWALAWFAALAPLHATANDIVTLDWTVAETLTALGTPPVGLAELPQYQRWSGAEAVPDIIQDIGLRAQPNRELIAQQSPNHILLSPLFMRLGDQLGDIAPVTGVATYEPGGSLWQRLARTTHTLADLGGDENAASALIENVEASLARHKAALDEQPPLIVLQFIDARHLRVFGEQSLFEAVMARMGLVNAWREPTNQWGFSTVALEELLRHPEATLVVVEPLPAGLQAGFSGNALWQHLPAVRQQRVIQLPAVWSFGGFPSAARFADLLGDALTAPDAP